MKTVVIGHTGAIGSAIAKHRSLKGDEVIGLSRSTRPCFTVDNWYSVADAATELDHVDALIYCVGTHGAVGEITFTPAVCAVAAIHVNLVGAYHCLAAFTDVKRMVFMGGGGAASPRPAYAAYAASKAGLVRLIETAAAEDPQRMFNVVAPGVVRSQLTADNPEARDLKPGDRLFDLIDHLLDSDRFISGRFIHYRDEWEKPGTPGGVLRRVTTSL